ENQGTDGSRCEGERQREGDAGVGLLELLGDGGQRHHHQEKIEGVQGPAEEAGHHGGTAIANGYGRGRHGRKDGGPSAKAPTGRVSAAYDWHREDRHAARTDPHRGSAGGTG